MSALHWERVYEAGAEVNEKEVSWAITPCKKKQGVLTGCFL